jgi:hypothetical protein
MTFKGIVKNGVVKLPAGANWPDGTVVRIEATIPRRFGDLLDLAGTWAGDDAERIVEEIYTKRTTTPLRAPFNS